MPGMINPNMYDPSQQQAIMDAIGTDPEEEALTKRLAMVQALKGGAHTTGLGGALGAAGDVLNTIKQSKLQDKLGSILDVRAKGQRAYNQGLFGFGGDDAGTGAAQAGAGMGGLAPEDLAAMAIL